MAQLAHRVPLTLNTDGRRHPRENALAAATVALALIAIVCAFFDRMHVLGSWSAIVGLLSGFRGQMISATTAERFVFVIALGVCGVALMFNLAHGGLY